MQTWRLPQAQKYFFMHKLLMVGINQICSNKTRRLQTSFQSIYLHLQDMKKHLKQKEVVR